MPLWQPRWSILPHAPKFNAPQECTAVSALGWGGVLRHRLAERRFEHLYRAGDIGVFSGRLFLGGSRPEQKCLSKINETAAGQTRRSGAQTALLGHGGGPSPLWEAPVGSRAIRRKLGSDVPAQGKRMRLNPGKRPRHRRCRNDGLPSIKVAMRTCEDCSPCGRTALLKPRRQKQDADAIADM